MVETASVSHPGRIRKENEDFVFHGETPNGYVAIVCDGMGGHAAGEVAARLAAQTVFDSLTQASSSDDPAQLLTEAIGRAHEAIRQHGQQHTHTEGLGTTIVVGLLRKDKLYYAHVGDSRLYLYERGHLQLLTEDDSLVHQMLREGLITPEQALHHPQKNVLSQSLGGSQPPAPHVAEKRLSPGTMLLLCTDGLSNLLSQEEMASILAAPTTLSEKADTLVQKAILAGGYDNISVLLIALPQKRATFAQVMNIKQPPIRLIIGGVIALAVIIAVVVILSRPRPTPEPKGDEPIIIMDDSTAAEAPTEPMPLSEAPKDETPMPATPPTEVPPPTETALPPTEKAPPTRSTTTSPSKTTTSTASHVEITIQKGDNLDKIARIFHTTRRALQELNNLSGETIKAGQKLKVPVKSSTKHTVQKGETLSQLARKYHSSIEAIRKVNNLSDKDEIKAGQKLQIPILK